MTVKPMHLRVVPERVTSMTLDDLRGFESWMRSWGAAETTITSRMLTARNFMKAGHDPLTATTDDVARYIGAGGWSGWTLCTYWSSLRSLFDWLTTTGRRESSPMAGMRRPRTPRSAPRPIPPDLIPAIMGTASPRVHAYLTLAMYAGLRAHEIAAVQARDVTRDSIFVVGKGAKGAYLPTHPAVWDLAQEMPSVGHWFPGRDGGHVSRTVVSHAVSAHLGRHGLSGSIHRARHTYATTLLRSGVNMRVVQTLMRHESLASTQMYTLVEDSERTAAILGLDFAA